MRSFHSRAGFTLIELLMVILVISMVAVFAGQNLTSTFQKIKVEKSAREVMMAARYARMVAIEQQSLVRLKLNQETGSIVVIVPQPDGVTAQLAQDAFFKPKGLEEGIRYERIQAFSMGSVSESAEGEATDEVIFRPDGSSDNAIIVVGDGQRSLSIRISPLTGKIKIAQDAEQMSQEVIDLDAS